MAFGQLAPSADRGPSVEQGAAFVQAVGHPNGGLLVDVHQAVRGGSTWASLAHAIDPAYLRAVELSDGPVQPPSDLSVPEEAMHARSLPGQGEWDLAGFVATMRERGFTGPWAVEMCSPSFRALPVREALRRAAGATLSVL
ncbi:sugar phosphate isomerase/epimerase family protein [Nocardioides bruguierae]|uniref:Sugar phosphate isomerase/epimerase n=1 Tax=Nocardioides bruguierae TaxID=2945102 RepID=A0A9X2D970_9ACTN|nr:TIM barrel protein [Nocardioides bruguierae]MCM0621470.1 sugar phosphate isomerase/epimerase [Nocardioides bruguierae]